MLTGEPPFTGPSAQAIVARIMTEEPRPITSQRNTVPPHVEDAVLTALAKLPADRWGSAKEFAEALAEGAKAQRRTGARTFAGQRALEPSRRSAILLGLSVLLAGLAAWGWLRPGAAPTAPVTRLRIAMSPGQALSSEFTQRFAISDDGSRMVYMGEGPNRQSQLWVRDLDALDARPLAGTQRAVAPSISPDGKWVLFVSDFKLRKVPVGGGDVTTLADSVNPIAPGGAWLGDGTIVFAGQDFNLRTVRAEGGIISRIPGNAGTRDSFGLLFPRALPRPDAALATGCDNVCNRMWVGVVNLRTGAFTRLVDESAGAWYSPTGHLVVVRRTGAVVAVPFDLDDLEVRGDPVPLFDGVHVAIGIVPSLALSPAGTLIYERSGLTFGRPGTIVRVSRTGIAAPVDPNWPVGEMSIPSLSPDGKRLAVGMLDGQRSDIWIKELDRGALTRLTTGAGLNFVPSWRPGGAEISYISSEGDWHIESRRPDGTGVTTRIKIPDATTIGGLDWSPEGNYVVVHGQRPGGFDIHAVRLGTDSVLPVAAGPFDEFGPALSPDGRWIAYTSTESGRPEVYVRPFPDAARERIPVSRRGGRGPGWSRDGRELFFVGASEELMSAPVTWLGRPSFGEPRALFSVRDFVIEGEQRSFLPEPGGRSFIMLREAESKAQPQLVLVLNWLEELKAKVGARR
jgi:serine/threonine-protein kinase